MMNVESKIISREISPLLWKAGETVCTARFLGVSQELLEEKGAVSEEVVRAMFEGALKAMETTYAIAITGYAGPGGGEEAPVGTIWIAVGDKNEVTVEKLEGDDGRDMNLAKATLVALQLLLDLLKKRHPQEEE